MSARRLKTIEEAFDELKQYVVSKSDMHFCLS